MKNRGFGKKKAGLLLCLSLLLFTGCGEGQAAGGTGLDSGSAQAEAGGTVQESTPAGAGGMVQNGSAPPRQADVPCRKARRQRQAELERMTASPL